MLARFSSSSLALLLVACTVQSTTEPAPAPAPTTPEQVDPPAEEPSCTSRELPAGAPKAMFGKDGSGKDAWLYEASSKGVNLTIESYAAAGGPIGAGEHKLTKADTSYETCGLCIVVGTECTRSGCKRTFMPEEGATLRITALALQAGGDLAGEISGLAMREVTIDRSGRTSPVADGESFCAPNLSLSAKMEELPVECGGHGHAHGDHCHCDPGYKPDPNDAMNCIPE